LRVDPRSLPLAVLIQPAFPHTNVALLKTLARVINEEAGIEELETDGFWRAA
jgi:hypothetical protein